jgi:hypothetical protein
MSIYQKSVPLDLNHRIYDDLFGVENLEPLIVVKLRDPK